MKYWMKDFLPRKIVLHPGKHCRPSKMNTAQDYPVVLTNKLLHRRSRSDSCCSLVQTPCFDKWLKCIALEYAVTGHSDLLIELYFSKKNRLFS